MSVVVPLRGPLSAEASARAQVTVEALLRGAQRVRVVVTSCDVTVVDAVARMRLAERRLAGTLEVVGADAALFAACGLEDVL